MKVLVTAGSTEVPIDRVRVISNIFGGITGTRIAKYFASRGDQVTLLTSNPDLAKREIRSKSVTVRRFRTFDSLAERLEQQIRTGGYDVIIHSAAVSDFRIAGIRAVIDGEPVELDPAAALKIPSGAKGLALMLAPTPKLIDQIRQPWGFVGVLVKFKLEVGMTEKDLLAKARRSMNDSRADAIVANCLEWSGSRALIGMADELNFVEVSRSKLPLVLRQTIRIIQKRGGA